MTGTDSPGGQGLSICADSELCFSLDLSRMNVSGVELKKLQNLFSYAHAEMQQLEGGAVANADEGRMVGHYWLRNSDLSPTKEIAAAIKTTLHDVCEFADAVHTGKCVSETGKPFQHILSIGIGGSALGPQLANAALKKKENPLDIFFIDNTDPDGIADTLESIPDISRTLCLVISKSGGTAETRNAARLAAEYWRQQGLDPAKAFVAVTGEGSALDQQAAQEAWLARFPMWDWVGGRTSQTSVVGILPAALQGIDVNAFLEGAQKMDRLTRRPEFYQNPAGLLAALWHYAGNGTGKRAMVVLPYCDRLQLLSRYLQQLVMESLGKKLDRDGNEVHQGLTVYGNKGSTDQHAYVQQLRDGLNNFFVVFVEILVTGDCSDSRSFLSLEVDPSVQTSDYLAGFLRGTRQALTDAGRESICLTFDELNERTLGAVIALFERAVGLYASMINVNAYNQPGVEAGKKAARSYIELQLKILDVLQTSKDWVPFKDLCNQVAGDPEDILHIVHRLTRNQRLACTAEERYEEKSYRLC